jgi:hypothetical protein
MQVARRSCDHAVGLHGPFLVVVWRRRTIAGEVAQLALLLDELANQYPQGVHLMQVVEESAIVPDAAARAALAKLLQDATGKVAFSSVTHEGGGFRASLIRSIVTGLLLLSKPTFPHLVFESTERALGEHAANLSIDPGDALMAGIVETVAELRAAISAM